MSNFVSLATKIKMISTQDIYRQTDAALTHAIYGDIPEKGKIESGMMKGKMLFSGDEKEKCVASHLATRGKCLLMAPQLSLGIYWVENTTAMIVTFKKGPVIGLFEKEKGKTFLVDVRRKKIQELEPITGFKKYISTYYKNFMKTAYEMDVLKPVRKELSSDPKPEKKRRGRPSTAASKKRKQKKQAEMKRKREEEEKKKEEKEEDATNEENTEKKEVVEVSEIDSKKKKKRNTKQPAQEGKVSDMPKKTKKIDLFEILTSNVDTTETQSTTKKKNHKK